MSAFDLDDWLAEPTLRTCHRRECDAGAAAVWAAAQSVHVGECPLLGRLIRIRLPRTDTAIAFAQLFRERPFALLDEGPLHTLSGLCGRIWLIRGDYGELAGTDAFAEWNVPGTVRVLFAHWAQDRDDGGSSLCSEVRIAAVDRRAGMYLRALDPFITAFQGLIGREPLALAVARAEAQA